jgi:glyoxylase-like metal-dependent hydrolase (beta-lactamase superfamily II)
MNHFARRNRGLGLAALLSLWAWLAPASAPAVEELAKGLVVLRGPVNGVLLERGGKRLAVYGDPREQPASADTVLFTHHRRDVVWAGRALVAAGAKAVVPAEEAGLFTEVSRFWSEFDRKRFHDYAQQSTKILGGSLPVARSVRAGESLDWEGLPLKVLASPGYTRGAVSYLLELDGLRLAFTGDLIYGDGRLFDLYSLQDAIPEAKIGGYHGYAGRLGDLLNSLRQLAGAKPDLIVPARGPVIRDPAQSIERLIARIQALYRNYLSIDALRWYFRDEHILAKARRILGPDAKVDWMPMAETKQDLPAWIVPIDNCRLLLSADKAGFLVDCGGEQIINRLKELQAAGKLASVEHVFITHYHDDHTDGVAKLVELVGATVHASPANWDILEHPGAYRLPCLTANPIQVSGRAANGARWRWKEFEMALYYFPGQTLHHDALLVKKDGAEQVLLVGDSFTPSGVDDYCLLNRNWLQEDRGYFYCLDLVRRAAPEAWLINQHVGPAFRFSSGQLDRMAETLKRRISLLRDLLPWDDPNFGLDESWARFYPYARAVRGGETMKLSLRIMNHSPAERMFAVRVHAPGGWKVDLAKPNPVRICAREEGAVEVHVTVPKDAAAGVHLLTADVSWADWELREWTEAMVTVRD